MSADSDIRSLVAGWVAAIQSRDLEGALRQHDPGIVMFDVPPPYLGVRGLDAYRDSWGPFFDWLRSSVEAIVNSTCTYPQVMAALNVQSPDVASHIHANPMASAWLQSLVAAPPQQRRTMIQQAVAVPEVQQNTGLINQVANTCKKY